MWFKTRSGYVINGDHILRFDKTSESGTHYIRATLTDASSVDLPGAYASEGDLQTALMVLTRAFDASSLV